MNEFMNLFGGSNDRPESIHDLLDMRVYGLRAIEEIDFGLVAECELPPALILVWKSIHVVVVPTISDEAIDFDVTCFVGGSRVDGGHFALRLTQTA